MFTLVILYSDYKITEKVMLTNNNLSPSFQGGFRFRQMPAEALEKLPQISNRGKQIFKDFENKGDVFIVTRKGLDKKVADFIAEHKLKFEYYKDINTKCGLDDQKPELLTAFLATIKEKPTKQLVKLKMLLLKS